NDDDSLKRVGNVADLSLKLRWNYSELLKESYRKLIGDSEFPEAFRSDRGGEFLGQELLGRGERRLPQVGVGLQAGHPQERNLVPREQRAGVHVMLGESVGADDVAHGQRLVDAPRQAGEDDVDS